MEIKINTLGRISGGPYDGWWIKVEPIHDVPGSTAFYIFYCDADEFSLDQAFDHWVEDYEHLVKYFGFFEEDGGTVKWMD